MEGTPQIKHRSISHTQAPKNVDWRLWVTKIRGSYILWLDYCDEIFDRDISFNSYEFVIIVYCFLSITWTLS